jgi:hypothetical protein
MASVTEKLLFLDFDGVLHPSHLAGEAPFSRAHLLEEILVQFSPKIVVSSSWRFTHNNKKLEKILPEFIAKLMVGVTGPAIIGKHPRFNEIQHFLQSYGSTDWRALDDAYWEFPNPCSKLIRCNPNTGVNQKELNLLAKWLADIN